MKKGIHFFALAVMVAMVADGATLARWNTVVSDSTLGSYEATELVEGVMTSALKIGGGLQAGGSTARNIYAATGYDTTSATAAMEAGDYWETSLSVETGYELQLTGIRVAFGGPKNGPMACQLAWSADDKQTWTYFEEFDLTRTATKYFVNSVSRSELMDLAATGTVWFRLVAWGASSAKGVGSFGQNTDGLVFEGEVISTENEPPTVRFSPEAPLAYVGETLTVEVQARPSVAKLISITVNPTPKGAVTPNLSEGTWTFVPAKEDFNKTFTLTVAVSNAYGAATGSVEVQVKGAVMEENGMTWRLGLFEETATVMGAYPTEEELIIPSSLGGYPVTGIGECAFSNCVGLTSVTIPDSVTNIASNAFYKCNGLTSVAIPQVVCNRGLSWVFPASYRLLTNVVIGATVTRIGNYAFSGCSALTSVHIHDLTVWSALSFLDGIPNPHRLFLNGVEVTNLVIPAGVTSIAEGPFSCCSGLQTITMSESVTNIGSSAFYSCTNLVELALPQGLTNIGTNAFSGCRSLKTLQIPSGVGTIGENAFMGCSAMSSLSIGKGVRSIGNQAFAGCTSLKTVTVPKHVSSMGTGVFSNCTSLSSVLILGNLESTGIPSPFTACPHLNSVAFGDNVTAIGDYLCWELSNLTSVAIPPGVTTIGNRAFYGCSSLKTLKIPDGVLYIGFTSLAGCSSLTSLVIPNTVEYIGTAAFENCKSLATLYVPAAWEGTDMLDRAMVPSTCTIVYGEAGGQEESEGTEIIGNVTWTYSVSNFVANIVHVSPSDGELVVPTALAGYLVTSIGAGAFSECSALMSLTIPDSVTNVASDAFSGCNGLNELHVPAWWTGTGILADVGAPTMCEIVYGEDGLDAENIDDITWYYIVVDDMVTIIDGYPIPEDLMVPALLDGLPVRNIGSSAFAGCTAMETVFLPESVTKIGRFAFQECPALQTVTMLGDITDDWTKEGDSPFGGCSNLATVNFGNGMTKIGKYMFDGCCSLRALTIPNSITNIGNRAFGFCSSLASLDLGQGLVRIGDATFRACTALKSVIIPDSVTTIGQNAFYQCTGLEEVAVGGGTQTIYQEAFRDCSSLRSVTLPDSITRIGNATFYNCRSLPTLWIPASVTNIGREAFFGCSSLETLWVPASWEGTDMLYDAEVPYGCKICYYNPNAGENETMTTPVPVPYGWLEDNAEALLAANTNDYEMTASGPAANGYPVWECYLVGLTTTNAMTTFQMTSISFEDGKLVLKWDPDLNDGGEKTNRVYVVEGTETLGGAWGPTNDSSRFFRVKVALP